MDILSVCPLQVGALYWMPREGSHAMTVICKGTFELQAGRAELAPVQDFVNEEENHWNDDTACSLYAPTDMAPFKRQADVMLVGEAFAPPNEPAISVIARLMVGPIDKAVEVYCDRHFNQENELVMGPRFTKMNLRYERSSGGPHGDNPVGIDREGPRDQYGRLPVPNLQPVGFNVATRNDFARCVGFGPIAMIWNSRRKLLGRHNPTWSLSQWHKKPLPGDIDGSYFNAAPIDQRIGQLASDQRIVLENLHPDEPNLVSHLPGIEPVAFVERDGAVRNLDMRADTLWIDTTRSACTMTWRAHVEIASPRERGRVLIGMARPGEGVTWNDIRDAADRRPETKIHAEETGDAPSTARAPELPFKRRVHANEQTAVGISPSMLREGPAFLQDQPSSPPNPTQANRRRHQLSARTPSAHDRSPSWLNQSTAAAAPDTEALQAGAQQPSPHDSLDGTIGYGTLSPWAKRSQLDKPASPSAPPAPPPPPAGAAPIATPAPPPPATSVAAAPIAQPTPAIRAPNPVAHQMREEASAQQSDSKPSADLALRAKQPNAQEIIELLWWDPDAMVRIREQNDWAELLAELRESEATDTPLDFDEEPPEDAPAEVRDRRDIVGIMTRGRITTSASLPHVMLDAVDDSGSFEPPMVLMSGRIHLPFDELEILKATLAAVTPLVAGNKDLKQTVDTVQELMSTPWLQEGSGEVAAGLTERVRESFKRGDRMLDPTYLDGHTDRILLEQRRYQKRVVLGAEFIRAQLAPSAARDKLPAYLNLALHNELPMFKQFSARVIGEAHIQQDQYETHEYSLKVVALGRVVKFTRSPTMQ